MKAMVKRMCQETPSDWDRHIAPLLLAYREVPQASLGVSSCELLYGSYRLAHGELDSCCAKYRHFYNRNARTRKPVAGDQVLILLPTDHNKLALQWKVPHPVVSRQGEMNYVEVLCIGFVAPPSLTLSDLASAT